MTQPQAAPSTWTRVAPWLLAAVLGVGGAAHFVITERYQRIIPPQLPFPRELVYLSGVAELLCAGGLAYRPTRRIAGWASAVLLVAVFPANIQMALMTAGRPTTQQIVGWGRLPLQVPLVLLAVQIARQSSARLAAARRTASPSV
ncbi:MAG: hypothetical protein WCB04_12230 [Mycobacteriales bacterium]